MKVRMFGVLAVECGGTLHEGRAIGGAKARGLLEILLLARGRPVTKDALAAALWDGRNAPPVDAFRTLEHYVCVLRNRLCSDRDRARAVLVTGPNSYRINTDLIDLDLDRFDALLLEAEQACPTERRSLLGRAVALAHGDLLEDSPFAAWAEADRYRYRDRLARSHLWLAGDLLADGDMHVVLRHCEAALQYAPYSEQAYRLQMVANYALGCSDMARSTFHRCRRVLADALDLDPTSDTVAIAAAIDGGAPVSELVSMLSPALV
jgi:DNA-binding SARP family transcriptional activator